MLETGKLYFVKDDYFYKHNITNQNKGIDETGKNHDRPYICALMDPFINDIFWMVPLTSKSDKYISKEKEITQRFGECTQLQLVSFLNMQRYALIQNAIPVAEEDISRKYIINNTDCSISPSSRRELTAKMAKAYYMINSGIKLGFIDIALYNSVLRESLTKNLVDQKALMLIFNNIEHNKINSDSLKGKVFIYNEEAYEIKATSTSEDKMNTSAIVERKSDKKKFLQPNLKRNIQNGLKLDKPFKKIQEAKEALKMVSLETEKERK